MPSPYDPGNPINEGGGDFKFHTSVDSVTPLVNLGYTYWPIEGDYLHGPPVIPDPPPPDPDPPPTGTTLYIGPWVEDHCDPWEILTWVEPSDPAIPTISQYRRDYTWVNPGSTPPAAPPEPTLPSPPTGYVGPFYIYMPLPETAGGTYTLYYRNTSTVVFSGGFEGLKGFLEMTVYATFEVCYYKCTVSGIYEGTDVSGTRYWLFPLVGTTPPDTASLGVAVMAGGLGPVRRTRPSSWT